MTLTRIALLFFLTAFGWNVSSQKLYLKIKGKLDNETTTIDSLGYNPTHLNGKSITDETNLLSHKLHKTGYLENELIENNKINDSTFLINYSLGKKTRYIHIFVANSELKTLLPDFKNDTLIIPLPETEAFMTQTLSKLEKNGYALSKLQLANITTRNDHLEAELQLKLESQRRLNDIVINGYPKFPEGHKRNIKRLYKDKIFNQDNLKNLYADFEKFRFIKHTKYPEILFSKDSTKVYVYLEKTKSNTFDGFIGFANDGDKKIVFTGYVDLLLKNILNTGETFTLYWKSDGNDQKTFNAGIELPYVFKSRFGIKAQLNIFKQDSTFQNTRTALDVGYFFSYNTRLYLGYQSTESSDIQNLNTTGISDYKNAFGTTNFEFADYKTDEMLFPEKTRVNVKGGIGSRNSKLNTNKQFFISMDLKYNIYLNEKNIFNIKSQNYYLNSDGYIINELYRFGGINSIRGFNENSLQAHLFSSILTEYRYVPAPGIYVHSIIDYGYFMDDTSNNNGSLLGLGFGFGLLTKNGLFNIVYANGSTKEQSIKLSNSIVHISFKTNF